MHALPRYALFVAPQHLMALNENIWAEKTVPAYLKTGVATEAIRLKYRGAHTRSYTKKSFYIRGERRESHLNADFVDPSAIRSKLSFDSFLKMNVLSPRATHVTVSLNGAALGVYTLLESVDQSFLKRRRLPRGDIFYAIDNRANFSLRYGDDKPVLKKKMTDGYELKVRHSREAWQRLARFIWQLNTVDEGSLKAFLVQNVAVKHYLRWLAGVVLTSNVDGFIHNYALYFHPVKKKWWIIPWDYDGTWGRDCYGEPLSSHYVPLCGYNRLTERVLSVPEFKAYYVQFMTDILTRTLAPHVLMPKIDQLMARVRPEIARYEGEPYDIDHLLDKERQLLAAYVWKRRRFLLRELRSYT
ncbi:CotH kinase family protein [Numidum massiliense]|uniref:CotH kinase family protein n=1 Tax=Numidum massiliense TaxID=1522315 RepID=UPI0006D5827F|nr:CotH kinase family protein [Numidum massiliense]